MNINTGPDLGKPSWRIKIKLCRNDIEINSENFEFGFYSGEDWDRVHTSKSNLFATVITKDYSKLESYKPILIFEFYKLLESKLDDYQLELERTKQDIFRLESLLRNDLFNIVPNSLFQRDAKIEKILE